MSNYNIRINKKNENDYQDYDVVSTAENVTYYNDANTPNLLNIIQTYANSAIAPQAVYWEELTNNSYPYGEGYANLNYYFSEGGYNLANAQICNDGQCYVIACPRDIDNNHDMGFFISGDGGYRWNYFSHVNNNASTQINVINNMQLALTAAGYKLVITGIDNSNNSIHIYACFFSTVFNITPLQITFNLESVKLYDNSNIVNIDNNTKIYKSFLGFEVFKINQIEGTQKYLAVSARDDYRFSSDFITFGFSNNKSYVDTSSFELCESVELLNSSEILYYIYDEMINKKVLYNTFDIALSTYDSTTSLVQSAEYADDYNELLDVTKAFKRAISLHKTSTNNFISFFIPKKNSFNQYCYITKELPVLEGENNYWRYIVGNDYRLYIISTQGDVIYTNRIELDYSGLGTADMNFVTAIQDEDDIPNNFHCLKSYAGFTNAQFCCGEDNDDIVGIINDDNHYKIIHTHVGNII